VRRHRLDPFSLVFGATFLLIGLTFLVARIDESTLRLRWLWPAPLIVLGALIIATAARGDRPARPDDDLFEPEGYRPEA
jgi:hypothetical protein